MPNLRIVTALAAVGAFQIPSVALAQDFPAVVSEVLQGQTEGRISEMDEEQKLAMIECVNGVLADLPDAKKRYVMEGEDFDSRQDRFGEVVKENRAEWEQKIAQGCSDVAMSDGN